MKRNEREEDLSLRFAYAGVTVSGWRSIEWPRRGACSPRWNIAR